MMSMNNQRKVRWSQEVREAKAGQLFDLLAASPEPMRRNNLMESLDIPEVGLFHEVKGALQDQLAEGDTITVVGESTHATGAGGWYYSLDGDPGSDKAIAYSVYKQRSIFGRQKRAWAVCVSLAEGSDARTNEGKAIRRQLRGIERSMEDTIDVLSEMGVTDLPHLPWK